MNSYSKIIRASAIYDILATSLFAIPGVAVWVLNTLQSLHVAQNLAGAFPDFQPLHLLFVHFVGSVVTIWSIVRFMKPDPLYGLLDSIARVLFFIAMLYAWLNGATDLLVFFMVPELAWGIVQLVGYIKQTVTLRRLHVHW